LATFPFLYYISGIPYDATYPENMAATTLSYAQWLPEWVSHLAPLPLHLKIPSQAVQIYTPLIKATWHSHLIDHPNQPLAWFFLKGITEGFKIGCNTFSLNLKSAKRNLHSVLLHPEVISEYIQNEFSLGRISGPYEPSQCPEVHISRFGVIPKHQQPNKWHLIIDLCHPQGNSVNDAIPPQLCSLSYVTVDDAILSILCFGKGTMLAKLDFKSAFWLLPIHPSDRHLLTMKWKDKIYIDGCLPFGL